MKHSIGGSKLNRNYSQRQALFKVQLRQLIAMGKLETTQSKGKVLVNSFARMLNKASVDTVHVRRQLRTVLEDTDLVNKACDLAKTLNDKKGVMVKVVRLGCRRGDNTMMVRLELMNQLPEVEADKEKPKEDKKVKNPVKKSKNVSKTTKK